MYEIFLERRAEKDLRRLTAENRVAVFDAATGELCRTFAVTGSRTEGRQLVVSHTGRWLAVNPAIERLSDLDESRLS